VTRRVCSHTRLKGLKRPSAVTQKHSDPPLVREPLLQVTRTGPFPHDQVLNLKVLANQRKPQKRSSQLLQPRHRRSCAPARYVNDNPTSACRKTPVLYGPGQTGATIPHKTSCDAPFRRTPGLGVFEERRLILQSSTKVKHHPPHLDVQPRSEQRETIPGLSRTGVSGRSGSPGRPESVQSRCNTSVTPVYSDSRPFHPRHPTSLSNGKSACHRNRLGPRSSNPPLNICDTRYRHANNLTLTAMRQSFVKSIRQLGPLSLAILQVAAGASYYIWPSITGSLTQRPTRLKRRSQMSRSLRHGLTPGTVELG